MDRTDYTKAKFIEDLKANKGAIEDLGSEKIAKLLDDEDILDLTNSQAADKLISHFNKDSNYSKIFR